MTATTPCQVIAETIGQLYTCTEVNGFVRIRTPYLYPDGDVIDLFFKEQGQVLTDLGETLRWLQMQTSNKYLSKDQESLLKDIQITFGIELHEMMLLVRVHEDLADSITRLVQAAIAVSNLWFLSRTQTASRRKDKNGKLPTSISRNDQIAKLLDESEIRYERDLKLVGRSNRNWEIDFQTGYPMRSTLVEVLTIGARRLASSKVNNTVAAWVDLEGIQINGQAPRFISLFDDSYDVWTDSHISQLSDISQICFLSRPEELIEQLVT